MNTVSSEQLMTILKQLGQTFLDAAQALEVDSIPKGAHYVYGTASGNVVSLECNGITAVCPVLEGRFGYDMNTLSIPAAYGTQPGALPGQLMSVFLDGVLKAQLPFVEKGLTELQL
jgi:hypothetical protein